MLTRIRFAVAFTVLTWWATAFFVGAFTSLGVLWLSSWCGRHVDSVAWAIVFRPMDFLRLKVLDALDACEGLYVGRDQTSDTTWTSLDVGANAISSLPNMR